MLVGLLILSISVPDFCAPKSGDNFLFTSDENTAEVQNDYKLLMHMNINDQMNGSSLNEFFKSRYDYTAGSSGKAKILKDMMKMIKRMQSEHGKNKLNKEIEVEELSPLKQKKKLYLKTNGTIFSIKFRLQNGTKPFSLQSDKTTINEGNSRFGDLFETDNIEESTDNIYIPHSILNPETINNSLTLILTYVKQKNPFSKIKPEFKHLFDGHKYVFWKIPEEFQFKIASIHLQIGGNNRLTWTEIQKLNANDVKNKLVEFDVTDDLKNKDAVDKGKLILKTKQDIFESDVFKIENNTEKNITNSTNEDREDYNTVKNNENDPQILNIIKKIKK